MGAVSTTGMKRPRFWMYNIQCHPISFMTLNVLHELSFAFNSLLHFLCGNIEKIEVSFLLLCSRESWKQCPRFARQDKLSHSVMSHPVWAPAQMTELLSLGTATSTGEYLHVSQPVRFLLRLNLSSFQCLLSLFSCSLFDSSQHSSSVTHCPAENKGSAVGDKMACPFLNTK